MLHHSGAQAAHAVGLAADMGVPLTVPPDVGQGGCVGPMAFQWGFLPVLCGARRKRLLWGTLECASPG